MYVLSTIIQGLIPIAYTFKIVQMPIIMTTAREDYKHSIIRCFLGVMFSFDT
jgi:hypothetical protein